LASTNYIKVVVADDHKIFRQGFISILNAQKGIRVIAEAENGKELIKIARKTKPDLVITDIKMPVMNGLEASQYITSHFPLMRIIALTMFNDDQLMTEMFRVGISDCLFKNADISEVVEMIYKNAFKKTTFVSKRFNAFFLRQALNIRNKKKPLTEKQIEIVKLICGEYTSKEIAIQLRLSERTVEEHRHNIQQKIGTRNIVGVILYAVKKGIFKIDEPYFQSRSYSNTGPAQD
jgi:DNA-binding NarL/FixJ family response regulator